MTHFLRVASATLLSLASTATPAVEALRMQSLNMREGFESSGFQGMPQEFGFQSMPEQSDESDEINLEEKMQTLQISSSNNVKQSLSLKQRNSAKPSPKQIVMQLLEDEFSSGQRQAGEKAKLGEDQPKQIETETIIKEHEYNHLTEEDNSTANKEDHSNNCPPGIYKLDFPESDVLKMPKERQRDAQGFGRALFLVKDELQHGEDVLGDFIMSSGAVTDQNLMNQNHDLNHKQEVLELGTRPTKAQILQLNQTLDASPDDEILKMRWRCSRGNIVRALVLEEQGPEFASVSSGIRTQPGSLSALAGQRQNAPSLVLPIAVQPKHKSSLDVTQSCHTLTDTPRGRSPLQLMSLISQKPQNDNIHRNQGSQSSQNYIFKPVIRTSRLYGVDPVIRNAKKEGQPDRVATPRLEVERNFLALKAVVKRAMEQHARKVRDQLVSKRMQQMGNQVQANQQFQNSKEGKSDTPKAQGCFKSTGLLALEAVRAVSIQEEEKTEEHLMQFTQDDNSHVANANDRFFVQWAQSCSAGIAETAGTNNVTEISRDLGSEPARAAARIDLLLDQSLSPDERVDKLLILHESWEAMVASGEDLENRAVFARSVEQIQKLLREASEVFAQQTNVVQLTIEAGQQLHVVGDLHGQYWDLLNIFRLKGKPSKNNRFLFNGDLVDRGQWSLEILMTVLGQKMKCKNQGHECVYISRGNHESANTNARKGGFLGELQTKFNHFITEQQTQMGRMWRSQAGETFWEDPNTKELILTNKEESQFDYGYLLWRDHFLAFFKTLPLVYVVNKEAIVVHGGLPVTDVPMTFEDINSYDRKMEPEKYVELGRISQNQHEALYQMLWNDPSNETGDNFRGKTAKCFDRTVTDKFLQRNQVKFVVRSHQLPECIDGDESEASSPTVEEYILDSQKFKGVSGFSPEFERQLQWGQKLVGYVGAHGDGNYLHAPETYRYGHNFTHDAKLMTVFSASNYEQRSSNYGSVATFVLRGNNGFDLHGNDSALRQMSNLPPADYASVKYANANHLKQIAVGLTEWYLPYAKEPRNSGNRH